MLPLLAIDFFSSLDLDLVKNKTLQMSGNLKCYVYIFDTEAFDFEKQ
jgi:hypothetical protein